MSNTPLRNPYSFVPHGKILTPPVSHTLSLAGIRHAELGVIRPSTSPPAHKKLKNPFPIALPARTALTPDRLFDLDIKFPRGDVGAQQFGRPTPKTDGDGWAKATRSIHVREVGTRPNSTGVRAFVCPRSEGHIIYQQVVPPPRYGC